MLARSPQPETLDQYLNHGALVKLTTDRLHIRPFEQADVTDQYLGWLQDAEVTRFSNQRFRHHTMESCLSYQSSFRDSANSFLLIIHRRDETPIGTMTIYRAPPHGTADIGLMLGNRTYWRQGLGLEAWSSVVQALLEEPGLRKVTGGTARPNIGMVKIMEESGMKLEAVRHQQELIENQPVDLLYYARFAEKLA